MFLLNPENKEYKENECYSVRSIFKNGVLTENSAVNDYKKIYYGYDAEHEDYYPDTIIPQKASSIPGVLKSE